jgi:predicted NAD/FAD-dependent oxidoreductase
VISTAPPAQTSRLFANVASDKLASKQTEMLGCFTLMLGFASPLHLPWIAAKIRNSPVEWVAVNSSKPQRKTDRTSLVIHSNNAWAQDHIDDDQSAIEGELLRELSAFTGIDGAIAECRSLHRWRYALRSNEPADQPIQDEPYLDTELRLGSVGDWCSESRIESVWSGAMTYAARLQNSL